MKRKNMMYLIFFTFLIIVLIFLQKSVKKDEQNRLMAGKFAIGTFEGFGYSYKAGGKNYNYSYYDEDEGRIERMTDQRRIPKFEQRSMFTEGDHYLVLYDKDGSEIYFDRPIKDSSDFNNYVREFEEMRKQKK